MPEPEWRDLIEAGEVWLWEEGRLVHRDAQRTAHRPRLSRFYKWVLRVYAAQNSSRSVQRALGCTLAELGPEEWGLNFGSGPTEAHARVLNFDIRNLASVNVVGDGGLGLPFRDGSLRVVLSQEVLEHLSDPAQVVEEAFRVLKPGGVFYCQVPFMIGYHPGPTDYWRFTREGLRELFAQQPWEVEEIGITLGHGSGFYRIAVEYAAVTASAVAHPLYRITKGAAALALIPLKLPDLLTERSGQADRIPGGYFCIARKPL
jgi:SAM-dependent methyltransferase